MKEKINLFCFPFAGGSKYSFDRFKRITHPDIHLEAVELPGRGARFNERPFTSLEQMADDLFIQLAPKLNTPYAFWGHSMGALLAYLLCKKLTLDQVRRPRHLFVTGCSAPSVRRDIDIYHNLPQAAFVEKLRRLGGCPDEILEDEYLFGAFEPVLRADFQAVETYADDNILRLDIPITVMLGSQDENVEKKDGLAWEEASLTKPTTHEFKGGHFFIFDHEQEIMRVISRRLLSTQPVQL